MTLQQLRYLIAIAEYGSINAAAQNLYASQSNLSTAIKELEQELGITVFTRSNRGVTLTNDGTELLGYARQVIEQADMLEMRYADKGSTHLRLAVSTQHYAFSVQAFVNVVEGCKGEEYEFILRESTTAEIIDDVRTFRSEVGILYTDDFNRRVLQKAFDDADVAYAPLFDARVHVFVGEHHPLAGATLLRPDATTDTPCPPACCRPRCTRASPASRWTWTRQCRWATSCTTSAARATCCCATSTSCTPSSAPTPP